MRVRLPKMDDLLPTSGGGTAIVPPSGHTAWLTTLTAAAMAFLAVFALGLALAAERLANQWGDELAETATIRVSAPAEQQDSQVRAVLAILETTPGVAEAKRLDGDAARALLEPWFGPDLPLESLPVPDLVEIRQTGDGLDAEGLRLRLSAEAPGAVLDDHTRWRAPLISAAAGLKLLGQVCVLMIAGMLAAMVTLASGASLAANRPVIRVLRLVGATDAYIARAFVRRFTLRAAAGAVLGVVAGVAAMIALPDASSQGGFLTGIGFRGWNWLWPLAVPIVAGAVAWTATFFAARRSLGTMT